MTTRSSSYIGRFAPSPSGPLHLGSMVAALGSYLDARAQGGRWLVRMEDIDPPREQPGAADDILRTLEAFGLQWDAPVVWQSERSEAYEQALETLSDRLFYCTCTRAQLRDSGGIYPGTCRDRRTPPGDTPAAIRLKTPDQLPTFVDRVQGQLQPDRQATGGDPVLKRKDGLWAYQLAVVVDDGWQGITDVVRGEDLLTTTPMQVWLQHCLNLPTPRYLHLAVLTDEQGRKLSKQNHAPSIAEQPRHRVMRRALQALGLNAPDESAHDLLTWAVQHWPARRPLTGKQALTYPDEPPARDATETSP